MEDACLGMNPQGNPKMMRQQLEDSGRGFALRETAERLKAARFVASQAKITVADAPRHPLTRPRRPPTRRRRPTRTSLRADIGLAP